MEVELIFTITMCLCFIGMILTQIVFWKHRRKARKEIITTWAKLLSAEKDNNIELINKYGDELIWNRYISQSQIDTLNRILKHRLNDYPILNDLYSTSKNRKSYLSDDDRIRIYGEKSD